MPILFLIDASQPVPMYEQPDMLSEEMHRSLSTGIELFDTVIRQMIDDMIEEGVWYSHHSDPDWEDKYRSAAVHVIGAVDESGCEISFAIEDQRLRQLPPGLLAIFDQETSQDPTGF